MAAGYHTEQQHLGLLLLRVLSYQQPIKYCKALRLCSLNSP